MAGVFQNRRGFTLLELAIVVSVIAAVTASGMMMGSSVLESAKKVSTNNKLDAIEVALAAYRMTYNRIPCPTDATLTESSSNFGVEGATKGACTGGAPAANYNYTLYTLPAPNTSLASGTKVVEGAVPVRTLNLPDEYQVDGWGRKLSYAVWAPITAVGSFTSYGIQPGCGGITVKNAGGGYRTQTADYALISYGPDGHGAYLKGGTRYNAGSTNTDEQTNAHYDNTGTDTGYAATYVQKEWTQNPASATDIFDDLVRFRERWQMQNAADGYSPGGLPCGPGFRADGVTAGDNAGYAVAVGDVNGDGIPDLIIGAPNANNQAGYVYVVFGTKSGFPDPLPLSSLNGTNGFRLEGDSASNAGWSVVTGDVNGDGYQDIIIGAPLGPAYEQIGYAYVVYGGPTRKDGTAWQATQALTLGGAITNGTNGFRLDGVGVSFLGGSVVVGDINGDGKADIIVGAHYGSGSASYVGYTYVVFGGPTRKGGTAWGSNTSLDPTQANPLINGIDGFRLDGVTASDFTGYSVAAGDINGDGKADIIIGAPFANGYGGSTYVVFGAASRVLPSTTVTTTNGSTAITPNSYTRLMVGQTLSATGIPAGTTIHDCNGGVTTTGTVCTASINLSANATATASGTALTVATTPLNIGAGTLIDGTHGFRLDGDGSPGNSEFGWAVATGDVNGDGYSDIIATARWGGSQGHIYVVYGGPTRKGGTAWPATGNLVLNTGGANVINGTDGFRIDGVNWAMRAGDAVAVGDINGDGYADIIIGAPTPGYTYAVFGGSTRKDGNSWQATQTLDTGGAIINGTNGFRLDGASASDYNGASVATGDINGDGVSDIITGAYNANSGAGSTYIYFGHKTATADPWPNPNFGLGGL